MKLTHITILLAVCTAGAALSGCTRTSDGSVVMTYSPTLPHFFYRDRPEEEVSPRERMASLDRFPSPPGGGASRHRSKPSPDVRMLRVSKVEAPFKSSASGHSLQCRDETSATGRVRVVCD